MKKPTLDYEMLNLPDTLSVWICFYGVESMVLNLTDLSWSLGFLQPKQNFFEPSAYCIVIDCAFTFGYFCSVTA